MLWPLGSWLDWVWLAYVGWLAGFVALLSLLILWVRLMRRLHAAHDEWFERDYARNEQKAREREEAATKGAGRTP